MKDQYYRRGDIVYIDYGIPSTGHEQRSGRPGIVVSNDLGNANSPTYEIVYLTTKSKNNLPTHVTIRSCKEISIALCESVYTIAEEKIVDYMCMITPQEQSQIDLALMISLGIEIPCKPKEEMEAKLEPPSASPVILENNENLEKAQKEIKELKAQLLSLQHKFIYTEAQRDTYKEILNARA